MTKQFSVSQLKDEVSIYDEFVDIPVTVQGKEYIVKMFPYFKPEGIRDLVNEMIDFFKASETEKLMIPQIEEDDLVGYFIVKHFTDMKFTKSKKAKVIYNEFKLVLNSQLFKVLMETYPQESIKSVYDRIFSVIENNEQLKNKFKETQDVIKDLPLENREIFEKLNLNNNVVQ
jgi:N-glycosylase/DNA lyase